MDANLTGRTFSKWNVIKRAEASGKNRLWLCRCECGALHKVRQDKLLRRESRQCRKCADADRPVTPPRTIVCSHCNKEFTRTFSDRGYALQFCSRDCVYKHRASGRDKTKVKARDAARGAIRRGKLTKQPCEVCGSKANIHAHHDDYSKPLEVRWLCRTCHNELHRQQKLTAQRAFTSG